MIGRARCVAVVLALVVLAWQVGNAARGRLVHRYLGADVAVSALLVGSATRRGDRAGAAWMLGAYAATGGVFLSATTDALIDGGYNLGRAATTFGLLVCLAWSIRLGRWLAGSTGHEGEDRSGGPV